MRRSLVVTVVVVVVIVVIIVCVCVCVCVCAVDVALRSGSTHLLGSMSFEYKIPVQSQSIRNMLLLVQSTV